MTVAGLLLALGWALSMGVTLLINPSNISDFFAFQTLAISICFVATLFISIISTVLAVDDYPSRKIYSISITLFLAGLTFIGLKQLNFFHYELTTKELFLNVIILGTSILIFTELSHFFIKKDK